MGRYSEIQCLVMSNYHVLPLSTTLDGADHSRAMVMLKCAHRQPAMGGAWKILMSYHRRVPNTPGTRFFFGVNSLSQKTDLEKPNVGARKMNGCIYNPVWLNPVHVLSGLKKNDFFDFILTGIFFEGIHHQHNGSFSWVMPAMDSVGLSTNTMLCFTRQGW